MTKRRLLSGLQHCACQRRSNIWKREQLVLRSRIDDELRTIERRLGELRRAPRIDPKAIDELVEKRETLKADAAVVDRADERGWDELKAVVEHDLEGQPQM